MKAPDKNRLEWTVFAASLALIVLVLGALIQFEITRPDTPPELHARTVGTRASGNGYAVVVDVENRGGATALNAVIEVELSRPGARPERSEVHLPFVPHGSVRTGEAVFTTDPSTGTLRARVVGYERP